MDQPITKSSLSEQQRLLVELLQQRPFCRIERLQVRRGEPIFDPAPKVIQKLRMGADNGPRPEAALPDFLLKRQTVELLETIAEVREGEIQAIDVQHGLPLMVEIERRPLFTGDRGRA